MPKLLQVAIDESGQNSSIVESDTASIIFGDGTGFPIDPKNDGSHGIFDFILDIVVNSLKPRNNTIVLPQKDLPRQDGILFDRRDPIFLVFIQGKNLKRTNISSMITSVSFTESDDQSNTCQIEFENLNLEMINDPIFNARNEVEIYIGYATSGVDFIGTFIIDKPKFSLGENITTSMNGKLINSRMTEDEKQEVHTDISDIELVDKIAKRNGFYAAISDSEVKNTTLSKKRDSIAQAGTTDWDLLRQRAFQNGFIVDMLHHIIDGIRRPVIYFGKPRNVDSGVTLSYRDPNPLFANLLSFEPTENTYKRNCGVKIGVHDPVRLGRNFREIFIGGPKFFTQEELDAAVGDRLEEYYSELDQQIERDTKIPSQYICDSDPDWPPTDRGVHHGPFNYQRSYGDIIGASDSENNLNNDQQKELNSRIINGEDPEIVTGEIRTRDSQGGFGSVVDDIINFIPNQKNNCRKTILSELGEEDTPEETCRLSNNIQESMRYVVEASCVPAIGNTRLRKGYLVNIKGVGKFSGKYYIKSVSHQVDSSGYKISSMTVKSKGTNKNSSPKVFRDDDRTQLPPEYIRDLIINGRKVIQNIVRT